MSHSKYELQDFYNFLNEDLPSQPTTDMKLLQPVRRRYFNYITSKASSTGDTNDPMNTVIRRKLRIIPKNIRWIYIHSKEPVFNWHLKEFISFTELFFSVLMLFWSWGGQSDDVFEALKSDFMRPRINEVQFIILKFNYWFHLPTSRFD